MATERPLLPDEQAPGAHVDPQTFYEIGDKAGQVAPDSTKVGWTLRRGRQIVAGFAFLINPQGIDRGHGTKATVFSTKGANYVDDFGAAPGSIVMRQLVGSGKDLGDTFYTAREDIQRFLKTIWIPVVTAPRGQRPTVYFHDHHFERGMAERVWFPPEGLKLTRDVDLHNVWRFELQMVGLERNPYSGVTVQRSPDPTPLPVGARYVVKKGDTLNKIIRKLTGAHATRAKVTQVSNRIFALNPQLRVQRPKPHGGTAKPYTVFVGEVLQLPRSAPASSGGGGLKAT